MGQNAVANFIFVHPIRMNTLVEETQMYILLASGKRAQTLTDILHRYVGLLALMELDKITRSEFQLITTVKSKAFFRKTL